MRLFAFISSCLFSFALFGQTAEVTLYGGAFSDEGAAVKETANGYIIAATSSSADNGHNDIYLVRILDDLTIEWEATFGGSGADRARDVVVTAEGDFLVLGETSIGENGGFDIALWKVNALGELQWEKNYGGSDWEFAASIVEGNGMFHIAGTTYSESPGTARMMLLAIDSDGNQLDYDTYDILPDSEAEDMIWHNEHLYLIGTRSFDNSTSEGVTRKLDPDGSVVWTAVQDSVAFLGKALSASQYGVAAAFAKNDANQDDTWDMFLVSYTEDGATDWYEWSSPPDAGNQIPEAVVWNGFDVTQAALTDIYGSGEDGVFLNRVSFEGAWLSSVVFGGLQDEAPSDLMVDEEGQLLLLGSSESYGSGDKDVYLVRFPNDNIVSNYELDTLDYTNDAFFVSVPELDKKDLHLWPNPASFGVNLPNSTQWWRVFNNAGVLVSEGSKPEIDLSEMARGMYFVRFVCREGQFVDKLIVE